LGRTLAVDLGTRRAGLALSDALGIAASPLETLPVVSLTRLAERLADVCREKGVEIVVVGLPVREDGREGEGCARSRKLIEMLAQRNVTAVPWDESWSSRDAEEILRRTGQTIRRAEGRVDAMAASLILRDYLDAAAAGPARSP
jgi:putative Holliday junction resolvase